MNAKANFCGTLLFFVFPSSSTVAGISSESECEYALMSGYIACSSLKATNGERIWFAMVVVVSNITYWNVHRVR